MHAERSAAGVGDDDGFATAAWDLDDPAVIQAGPDPPAGIDHDILRSVAGQGHEDDVGRGYVRQRIDGWRLPPHRVDTRLGHNSSVNTWRRIASMVSNSD